MDPSRPRGIRPVCGGSRSHLGLTRAAYVLCPVEGGTPSVVSGAASQQRPARASRSAATPAPSVHCTGPPPPPSVHCASLPQRALRGPRDHTVSSVRWRLVAVAGDWRAVTARRVRGAIPLGGPRPAPTPTSLTFTSWPQRGPKQPRDHGAAGEGGRPGPLRTLALCVRLPSGPEG